MSIEILDPEEVQSSLSSGTYKENVVPDLLAWTRAGKRCALVTLVGVDGNAPRAEGAQMAISETGEWSGYISGGCLEQTIALEAVETIKSGKPRLLRYGKGSPYFDIRLPCGSGLDIYVQPFQDLKVLEEMGSLLERRQPFALRIDLGKGSARLEPLAEAADERTASRRDEETFVRAYTPAVRCLIIGSSPIGVKLAELAACAGFDTDFYAPEPEALPVLLPEVKAYALAPRGPFAVDEWTAAILAFHDHEQELPVFSELLESNCFFITAIGSRNAHDARKLALSELGFSDSTIGRIQSPAGLVPGLKTAPMVALSILAQIVAAGREKRLL
ncbi:MAG: XdhC family protein [Rhodomicrobium sp.]